MPNTTEPVHVFVSIEDGVKKAEEYAPPRKVRVELQTDTTLADMDTALDKLSTAANARVATLLGQKPAVVAGTDARGATVEETANGSDVKAEAPKRGRPKKEPADPSAMTPEPETAEDPAAIGTTDAQGGTTDFDPLAPIEPEPAADDPAAMTGGEDVTAGVTVISDADLNDAVMKKNGELNDPLAIRKLIGSYNPDPTKQFMLAQIPQADRAGFLTKLGALKAAA